MNRIIIFLYVGLINLTPHLLISQNCTNVEGMVVMADSVFEANGDLDLALSRMKTTLNDCLKSKDSLDNSLGELYYKIGQIYYDLENDKEALKYLKIGTQIRNNRLGFYHIETSKGYYMQANSNYYLRNNKAAIEYGEKAVEALQGSNTQNKDSIVAEYYQHLSKCYYEEGDYGQALFYTKASLNSFPEKSNYSNYQLYHTKGKIHFKLNKYQLAIVDYQKAKQYIEKIGVDNEPFAYGTLMNEFGFLYDKLEKPRQAIVAYQEALSYYNIANPNAIEIANTYANLLTIATKLNQFSKADNYFKKGLDFAKTQVPSGFHPTIAELHYNKATTEAKQKKYDAAHHHLQQATYALMPTYQIQAVPAHFSFKEEPLEHKMEMLELLKGQAEIYQSKFENTEQLADLETLATTYENIDELTTQIRRGFKAADSKYALQEYIIPLYEKAILNAFELYDFTRQENYLETAYAYIAKNKAIILLEGLNDENAKFSSIPDSLLQKEKQIKKDWFQLESETYEAQRDNNDSLKTIKMEALVKKQRQYEGLIAQFEEGYPRYYELKYASVFPLTIPEIQEKLTPDRALIEFFLGTDFLFIFTITKFDYKPYIIKKADNLEQLVNDYQSMLRIEDALLNKTSFSQTSYQLYQALLAEPLKDLAPSVNRLILIPDDILLQISFDALLTMPYSIAKWNDLEIPYLIQEYALGQAYSNRLAFDTKSRERIMQAENQFLGFGLEYDSLSLEYLMQLDIIKKDATIKNRMSGRLHFSDDEIREIFVHVEGDTFINQAATKQAFLEYASNADILHIAAHGFADEENSLNSGIIFSKSTDTTENILLASEVFNMNLSAKMAVLSACQTGYGPLMKGAGMRTLAQAFAYAGCPSLIASLWNIPDASTKDILVKFYENLKQNQFKDIALRNAKLHYLKNTAPSSASPSHWAQTVLIGEAASLDLSDAYSWWWIILPIGLLFFLRKKLVKS